MTDFGDHVYDDREAAIDYADFLDSLTDPDDPFHETAVTWYRRQQVPPQGGYIAKQCPVVIQHRMLRPERELELPPTVQRRLRRGVEFEAALQSDLTAGDGDWVLIDQSAPKEVAIAQTVAAMEADASVIWGGFLPVDVQGRRTGRPDLLVHHAGGYVPVDVKHHATLSDDPDGSWSISPADDPSPAAATDLAGVTLRKHPGDALQLAHYRRMLKACRFASESSLAGILGTDGVVVWYDLDAPMWQTPAKSDGKKRKMRTAMERYDFEFDFRLDIAAEAVRHRKTPDVELLVEPMRSGECDSCGFREECGPVLERGSGDASLLPGLRYDAWRRLRDVGITDRVGVATLDRRTALVGASGIDPDELGAWAADANPGTAIDAWRPRSKKKHETLRELGFETAGDVTAGLDELTASLGAAGFLPEAILNARAATGPESVYRRSDTSGAVKRADLEVDLDMENTEDGVYLWGALVTDRSGTGLAPEGYRAFASWEPLTPEVEQAVFTEMWEWLVGLRRAAESTAASLRVYVWYEGAEATQLRRIGTEAGMIEAVEDLLASDNWTDLRKVFTAGWITGTSTGLKVIAPLAGHEWDVDDPGGDISMLRHDEAVSGGADGEAAQRWLLDYNRGDVEATLRIREWLDAEGSGWPVVDAG